MPSHFVSFVASAMEGDGTSFEDEACLTPNCRREEQIQYHRMMNELIVDSRHVAIHVNDTEMRPRSSKRSRKAMFMAVSSDFTPM